MPTPIRLALEIRGKKKAGYYNGKEVDGKKITNYRQRIAYELAERQKRIDAGQKKFRGKKIILHNPDEVWRYILKQNREDPRKDKDLGYRGPPTGISRKG